MPTIAATAKKARMTARIGFDAANSRRVMDASNVIIVLLRVR